MLLVRFNRNLQKKLKKYQYNNSYVNKYMSKLLSYTDLRKLRIKTKTINDEISMDNSDDIDYIFAYIAHIAQTRGRVDKECTDYISLRLNECMIMEYDIDCANSFFKRHTYFVLTQLTKQIYDLYTELYRKLIVKFYDHTYTIDFLVSIVTEYVVSYWDNVYYYNDDYKIYYELFNKNKRQCDAIFPKLINRLTSRGVEVPFQQILANYDKTNTEQITQFLTMSFTFMNCDLQYKIIKFLNDNKYSYSFDFLKNKESCAHWTMKTNDAISSCKQLLLEINNNNRLYDELNGKTYSDLKRYFTNYKTNINLYILLSFCSTNNNNKVDLFTSSGMFDVKFQTHDQMLVMTTVCFYFVHNVMSEKEFDHVMKLQLGSSIIAKLLNENPNEVPFITQNMLNKLVKMSGEIRKLSNITHQDIMYKLLFGALNSKLTLTSSDIDILFANGHYNAKMCDLLCSFGLIEMDDSLFERVINYITSDMDIKFNLMNMSNAVLIIISSGYNKSIKGKLLKTYCNCVTDSKNVGLMDKISKSSYTELVKYIESINTTQKKKKHIQIQQWFMFYAFNEGNYDLGIDIMTHHKFKIEMRDILRISDAKCRLLLYSKLYDK